MTNILSKRCGIGLSIALLSFTSCVQVEPRPDFDKARELIQATTGQLDVYDPEVEPIGAKALAAILGDGLTLQEALRLALVNNRGLQAAFQEIGVAHADWVQSSLLSNPSLDLLLRFPADGGRSMLEAVMGMELLELWRIPARKQAARLQLDATIFRIARQAGELVAETRLAFYRAQAAEMLVGLAKENLELTRQSFAATNALSQAGAADSLDKNLIRGPLLAAQLALGKAEAKVREVKAELAKIMSIKLPSSRLKLSGSLPISRLKAFDRQSLVKQALATRLDLRAIKALKEGLLAKLTEEGRKAWGDVSVGPSVERPAYSGDSLAGPALSLELPIFDQNQAQVAKALYQLRKLEKMEESAHVAVIQDVRLGVDRVSSACRNLEFLREQLLPQVKRTFSLAKESYTAGRSTLFAFIEVQRQLLQAKRDHIQLLLDAAIAEADLERVIGSVPGTVKGAIP